MGSFTIAISPVVRSVSLTTLEIATECSSFTPSVTVRVASNIFASSYSGYSIEAQLPSPRKNFFSSPADGAGTKPLTPSLLSVAPTISEIVTNVLISIGTHFPKEASNPKRL
jgi:hypothetical protein